MVNCRCIGAVLLLACVGSSSSCSHLILIDNHVEELQIAQYETWMTWARKDPEFDAERCLIVYAAVNATSTSQHHPATAGVIPIFDWKGDSWPRRQFILRHALQRFPVGVKTITITEGDVFVCWAMWSAFVNAVDRRVAARDNHADDFFAGYWRGRKDHTEGELRPDAHFAVLTTQVARTIAGVLDEHAREVGHPYRVA